MKLERKEVSREPSTKEETMQQSRFMILTGHLNDYPLSDLVGILRHQQKTGRLLIEYANGPATFFFKDGEFVDAQLDNLNGLQAICVALAQPPAPFNFNPLIQPSRRSIQNSLQKAVSELLGCWDESGTEVETSAICEPSPAPALPGARLALNAGSTTPERAGLPLLLPRPPADRYTPTAFTMAAAGLMMLGLSSIIAVTNGFGTQAQSAPPAPSQSSSAVETGPEIAPAPPSSLPSTDLRAESRTGRPSSRGRETTSTSSESRNPSARNHERKMQPVPNEKVDSRRPSENSPRVQSVKVVLQIENGRVQRASIANPRAGMDAYEVVAIRIARQRRYPSRAAGQETVTIKVNPPSQGDQ